MDELKARVDQFCQMELPGQPRAMHMGTSYLVNDLWREVTRLRAGIEQEAAYCVKWAMSADELGDNLRADRHYERAARLRALLEKK